MAKTSSTPFHRPLSRSLRVYQRIAIGFVGITLLMLLAVVYLSVSRATITIIAKPSVVNVSTALAIVPTPTAEGQVGGSVGSVSLTASRVFTLPAEGSRAVEAKSTGMVTLLNTTGSPQPLVATTRLLSPEGVLFRLASGVTVPANGQVSAQVVADVAGAGGDIGPTRFTIPGLAQSLQDKIYAVSDASMQGGVQYIRSLTDADIADAKTALTTELLAQAKTALTAGLSAELAEQGTYDVQETRVASDVPVGTEAGVFTLSLDATIVGVFYDKALVSAYARSLLQKRISEGFVLHAVNEEGVQVSIDSVDVSAGTAQLSVYLDGTAIISEDAPTLAKDRFLGRAPHEVFTLLQASDAISDVSLSFTPFWLQRVPTLKDHIEIVIKAPSE